MHLQLGCDLPMATWLHSSFVLPFKISPELASYGPDVSERILQRAIVPHGSKYSLFMQFKNPTRKVLRVTVIYKQSRILAIDRQVNNKKKNKSKNQRFGNFFFLCV